MYYDMNPEKRTNEWIKNVYISLLEWIEKHKGCTVQDIKIHLDILIKEMERYK